MNIRRFFLKPFSGKGVPEGLKIACEIGRSPEILSISYEILGPVAKIIIPPKTDVPSRRNGLWEETCFELFVGLENSAGYWEFNLSPAGHWNVYRFSAYRQGMFEEPAFTEIPFTSAIRTGAFRVSLELRLDKIVPAGHALEAGISVAIRTTDDSKSYWALDHPGTCPDFHRRDCFLIWL